jgi:hypothetical protein
VAPAGPSRKRGRPPKSQPPIEAPASKKPRKLKQAVNEPVPESIIEQINPVASAVPAAPEQQASGGVPQATTGKQSTQEVTTSLIFVSLLSNLWSYIESRCRSRIPDLSPRPFDRRICCAWERKEGSGYQGSCYEASKTPSSEEPTPD